MQTVYPAGSEFEGTEARVKDLEAKGFVKATEEKKRAPRKKVDNG